MPDALLGSGSAFDRTKSVLARWLRENLENVKSLPIAAISDYDVRFVAGWLVEVERNGERHALHILLDGQFPYTPVRIALKSKDVYLKWPHVERGGLLCLPRLSAPAVNLEIVSAATLNCALELIDNCANPDYVASEFRREFLSYWNRGRNEGSQPVYSLLDPGDHRTRRTAVWFGKLFTLVGESPDQVCKWLKHRFGEDGSRHIARGIFGFLDQAPAPPFPESAGDLWIWLTIHTPEAVELFTDLPIGERVALVLGAITPTGAGLVAMRIEPPRLNGFRKNVAVTATAKTMLWKSRSQLSRMRVERIDPAWVHGRGHNKEQPTLEKSSILLIGCGSLGSQVAVRLAQSGVGTMRLIDPQILVPANVGRHALGIDSVGKSKSRALAAELQHRFPHMRLIEGFDDNWQAALAKHPEIFKEASLIVACLGEWGADGQLSEWQTQSEQPIVYGWLDEHGVAAHALLFVGSTPTLACILDEGGNLRAPETLWDSEGLIQAEPACGTLFQPYGALDVAHAEMLLSRLGIDFLTGRAKTPVHRIYAGSTAEIMDVGGTWSPVHIAMRPAGLAGAFEYQRSIEPCGICPFCAEAA